MNDRPRRRRAASPTRTVVHRTYRSAHDDETRASPLDEPTEVLETEPPAEAPAEAPASAGRDAVVLADRYELGPILGRGASGVVYRGRDQLLGRDVAVKLLHTDLTNDREASARFQQEARLAARVHHPNAVAIYDIGEHDGQPFIVMECVSGETLSDRIANQPLTVNEAGKIGAQVLDALSAAHKQGVIHRDVKPGNLLMTPTGAVKVADFGIATAADRTALTSIGSVVGTLAYLAPERLQGAPATAQSDLYSTGVVLYEALTGAKPFAGDTPAALLSSIASGAAIDIRERRADIPESLATTIMRSLEHDPAARPGSAAEMARALTAKPRRERRSSLPAPPPAPIAAAPLPPWAPIDAMRADAPRRSTRRRVAFAAVVLAALATAGFAYAERGALTNPSAPSNTAPDDVTGAARVDATNTSVATTVTTTRPTTTTTQATTTRVSTTTRAVVTSPPKGKGKKNDDD